MINRKLVFRSLKGRCRGNQFCKPYPHSWVSEFRRYSPDTGTAVTDERSSACGVDGRRPEYCVADVAGKRRSKISAGRRSRFVQSCRCGDAGLHAAHCIPSERTRSGHKHATSMKNYREWCLYFTLHHFIFLFITYMSVVCLLSSHANCDILSVYLYACSVCLCHFACCVFMGLAAWNKMDNDGW